MTAVLGVRKLINGIPQVAIASDSLFSRGTQKIKAKDTNKLIKFPGFVVGYAGICTIQPVLYSLSQDTKFVKHPFMKMETTFDALAFGKCVFMELKDCLDSSGDNVNEHVGDIIIATPRTIYCVDKYSFVSEHDQWVSVGCAEDLLNGAMAILYPDIQSVEDLVEATRKAISAACQHSTGCEPPVRYEVVNPPKIIRKKPKPKGRPKKLEELIK